jgi:hypothetical protein
MKKIKIGKHEDIHVFIDDEMYEEVKKYNWHPTTSSGRVTIRGEMKVRDNNGKYIERIQTSLQHLVLGTISKGFNVYFKNGNTFDCRKENLVLDTTKGRVRGKKYVKIDKPIKTKTKKDATSEKVEIFETIHENLKKFQPKQIETNENIFLDPSQAQELAIKAPLDKEINSIDDVVYIITEKYKLFKLYTQEIEDENLKNKRILYNDINGNMYYLIINKDRTMTIYKNLIKERYGIAFYIPKLESKLLEMFSTIICL